MSRLELDANGRIVSPDGSITIRYSTPFPVANGRWPTASRSAFIEPANGMVAHTEVGYEHNVLVEFENPGSQASAFCSIGAGIDDTDDGHITQYGPLGKGWMAWTQGAGNPHWRGVEHEDGGDPTRPLTALQLVSSASLLELFSRVDGFPLQVTDDPVNGRGLITHQAGGAAWGGHACPGPVRAAQRQRIVDIAKQIRAGTPTPGDPDMTTDEMLAALGLRNLDGSHRTLADAVKGVIEDELKPGGSLRVAIDGAVNNVDQHFSRIPGYLPPQP